MLHRTLRHLQRETWAMCFTTHYLVKLGEKCRNIFYLSHDYCNGCGHHLGPSQWKCYKNPSMPWRVYPLSSSLEGGWEDEAGDFPAASKAQPVVGALIPRTARKWKDLYDKFRRPGCPSLSQSQRKVLGWECECNAIRGSQTFLPVFLTQPYPQNVENI